jgi:hypothetical protein
MRASLATPHRVPTVAPTGVRCGPSSPRQRAPRVADRPDARREVRERASGWCRARSGCGRSGRGWWVPRWVPPLRPRWAPEIARTIEGRWDRAPRKPGGSSAVTIGAGAQPGGEEAASMAHASVRSRSTVSTMRRSQSSRSGSTGKSSRSTMWATPAAQALADAGDPGRIAVLRASRSGASTPPRVPPDRRSSGESASTLMRPGIVEYERKEWANYRPGSTTIRSSSHARSASSRRRACASRSNSAVVLASTRV